MDQSSNIFSYCVGAFALISTITSVSFYCQLYLPTSQLKQLDELLLETKRIYLKANDERLLVPDVFTEAQRRLSASVFHVDHCHGKSHVDQLELVDTKMNAIDCVRLRIAL